MRTQGILTLVTAGIVFGAGVECVVLERWHASQRPTQPGDVFHLKVAQKVIGVLHSDGKTIYVNGVGTMTCNGMGFWDQNFDPALWERE